MEILLGDKEALGKLLFEVGPCSTTSGFDSESF